MEKLKSWIIREIPVDLHRETKTQAARNGVPLYQLVIRYVREGLKREVN